MKEKQPFKIDFAYGMATFDKDSKIDEVIEIADKAMYRNKKNYKEK